MSSAEMTEMACIETGLSRGLTMEAESAQQVHAWHMQERGEEMANPHTQPTYCQLQQGHSCCSWEEGRRSD